MKTLYGEIYEFIDYNKAYLYNCDKNGEKIPNKVYQVEFNDAEKICTFTYLDENKNTIISSNGYASEKREYDIYGNIIKVQYFDESNNPIADSDGDYGFEDIKNIDGLTLEEKLLGIDGSPHIGKDGYAIVKFDYDVNGKVTKFVFFDEYGNPVVNVDGDHGVIREYDFYGNIKYSKLIGIDEMPHNGKDGFSITRCTYDKSNNEITRSYFDHEDKPISCLEGYHYYEITNQDNITIKKYYDANFQLTNIKSKYATIIESRKNKYYGGYYGGIQMYKTYENSLGEKVNNEDGYHKIIYSESKDKLIKAFDSCNNKVIDNTKTIQEAIQLLVYFIVTIFIVIAYPFYFVFELKNYIFNLFKKETVNISMVKVKDVSDSTMAKALGVESDDFIIGYNEWCLFSENQTNIISEFENEFNKIGRGQKTILLGRMVENECIFFKLDFPSGVMGIHIVDDEIPQKQFEKIKERYLSELRLISA